MTANAALREPWPGSDGAMSSVRSQQDTHHALVQHPATHPACDSDDYAARHAVNAVIAGVITAAAPWRPSSHAGTGAGEGRRRYRCAHTQRRRPQVC
jgi:hypothetical protein